MSEFVSPTVYALDDVAAKAYLLRHQEDAQALVKTGLGALPYAPVFKGFSGSFFVGDVWCASWACAVAYILARWW